MKISRCIKKIIFIMLPILFVGACSAKRYATSDEWNVTNCTQINSDTTSLDISTSVKCYTLDENSLIIIEPLSNESDYIEAVVRINGSSSYIENYGVNYAESGDFLVKSTNSAVTLLKVAVFNYSSYKDECTAYLYTTVPTSFKFISDDLNSRRSQSEIYLMQNGYKACLFTAIASSSISNVSLSYTGDFVVNTYEKDSTKFSETTFQKNYFATSFTANSIGSTFVLDIDSDDDSYTESTRRGGNGFGGFDNPLIQRGIDDEIKLAKWEIAVICVAAAVVIFIIVGIILCCACCRCYCGCARKLSRTNSRVEAMSDKENNDQYEDKSDYSDKKPEPAVTYQHQYNNKPMDNPYAQDENSQGSVRVHYDGL